MVFMVKRSQNVALERRIEALMVSNGWKYKGIKAIHPLLTRIDETTASVIAFYECTVVIQHNMQ